LYSEIGTVAELNYDLVIARRYTKKSFDIKRQDDEQNIELAQDYMNLATIDYEEGNRESAVENCQKGLALFGPKNINTHFLSLTGHLACAYEALGEYAKAEEKSEIYSNLVRRVYGNMHPKIAAYLNNLAMIYDNSGKSIDALATFKECLKNISQLYSKGHSYFSYVLINITVCSSYMGELQDAFQSASESIQLLIERKNNDPYVFAWMLTFAEICTALGRYDQAKANLRGYLNSYSQMKEFKGKVFMQKCWINWDHYVHKRKDKELALARYRTRMAYLNKNPQAHPVKAYYLQKFAIIEILSKRYKKGFSFLKEAHKVIEKNRSFFTPFEIELHEFFQANDCNTNHDHRKKLMEFCEEYHRKYSLSKDSHLVMRVYDYQ